MAGEDAHAPLDPTMFFIFLVVVATVMVLLWLIQQSKQQSSNVVEKVSQKKKQPATSTKSNQKISKKKQIPYQKPGGVHQFSHPELLTSLKGHTGSLTSGAFSGNGKQFASASEDRTLLIWNSDDFNKREHRNLRVNLDFDYAKKVRWSSDDKALLIHKHEENIIEVYKVTKKPDGSPLSVTPALTFPQHNQEADLIALEMAVKGKFIMTCNNKNQLVIWNLRGKVLECVDTRHGDTYSARLSPCGRFVATSGFTPDVKVWEVKFNKSGTFEGVKRAYDLSGHTAGIFSCDINSDSTRMVSVSRDKTWRLYNTNIEYEKGQLVYLLHKGSYDMKGNIPAVIRLSPDARTIVVACGSSLTFFSAVTGEKFSTISDIYAGAIFDMFFDSMSKFLLTLGDRHIRVFHNMAGYMATIQDLQQSLHKSSSSGMRDRISLQIRDAKVALENVKKTIARKKK